VRWALAAIDTSMLVAWWDTAVANDPRFQVQMMINICV
jgi:hypothetical protein